MHCVPAPVPARLSPDRFVRVDGGSTGTYPRSDPDHPTLHTRGPDESGPVL